MEQIPPIPIPDINKLFNLYLPTNTFSQYNTNNNTWYQTFLGLYKYTFDRNPHYDITITYIDGSQQIISLMQNNSAFIENKIIFDNVVEFNDDLDNLYILTPSIGDKLYLNNQQGRGIIIEYIEYNNINNPLDPNNGDLLWMYYSPSTIMAIKFENETKYKYVYNAFDENYFLTSDSNFSGKIITDTNILSLEIEPDNIEYKFGDLILLMDGINNGNIYELTYSSEFETPYVFKLLTNQQSYFKANDKIYTVNVNGVDKYIVEKPDTNYFVGKIITQNIIDYEDGEYYSLNITSPFTINDRVYNFGDICQFKDNLLNVLLQNGEPYEIYNDGEIYVFTGTYYGLKEYSGYSSKSSDLSSQPLIKYKPGTFVLTFDINLEVNSNISLYYRKQGIYEQVKLLPKTIFKDISNGKIYLIDSDDVLYGVVNEIIYPGIKLNDAIVSKYIINNNESVKLNLLKSSSRLFKQIIDINPQPFIEFNPQPPINSKYINDCNVVIKNENLKWVFETKNIIDNSIVFEYYYNGVNYNLIYNIKRVKVKDIILGSSKFDGSINFENETNIQNNYVLSNYQSIININYTNILGQIIENNGIINIPSSGLYNISVIINYSYDPTIDNILYYLNSPNYILQLIDGTQQPYNLVGNPLAVGNLQLIKYGTISNFNYSPINNGTVNINTLLELSEDDKLALIYNNITIQTNIISINGYINISKLS